MRVGPSVDQGGPNDERGRPIDRTPKASLRGGTDPTVEGKLHLRQTLSNGHIDDDGHLDLVAFGLTTDGTTGGIQVFLGQGDGTFGTAQQGPPVGNHQTLTVADFDSDGRGHLLGNLSTTGKTEVFLPARGGPFDGTEDLVALTGMVTVVPHRSDLTPALPPILALNEATNAVRDVDADGNGTLELFLAASSDIDMYAGAGARGVAILPSATSTRTGSSMSSLPTGGTTDWWRSPRPWSVTTPP